MKNTYPYIFFGNETKEVIKNVDIVRNKYVIRKDLLPSLFSTADKYIISTYFFYDIFRNNYFKGYSYCSKNKEVTFMNTLILYLKKQMHIYNFRLFRLQK